jgi:prevent-host-death family protein
MSRITTYSDARAHLKAYCDEVAESGEPLIIKRRSGSDVALVSLEELVGLEEVPVVSSSRWRRSAPGVE